MKFARVGISFTESVGNVAFCEECPRFGREHAPSLTPTEQATDQFDETRLKERAYLLSEQPRYMKGGSDGNKCIVRHQWILYSNTTEITHVALSIPSTSKKCLFHQLCKLGNKNLVGALRTVYLGVQRMCEYYRERYENEKKAIGVGKHGRCVFRVGINRSIKKGGL
jgi:hypothetical protein